MSDILANIVFNAKEKHDLPLENLGKIIWNFLQNRDPQDVVYVSKV